MGKITGDPKRKLTGALEGLLPNRADTQASMSPKPHAGANHPNGYGVNRRTSAMPTRPIDPYGLLDEPCDECEGEGEVEDDGEVIDCPECDGEGFIR